MNLYEVARRVWAAKLAGLICALLAGVIAILIAFQVSFSGPLLRPRALQLGVAGVQILVDSRRSSLADTEGASSTLAALAGDYTELIGSGQIVDPIARSVGVSPSEIGVTDQLTQEVALSQSQPEEPQVGTELLASLKHYSVTARNDTGSQVIQVYTQAPSGAKATAMANAAAAALTRFVSRRATNSHTPKGDQVLVRPIAPAVGKTIDRGASLELAILIGVLAWGLAIVAVLTLETQVRHVRTRREAAAPGERA